MGDALRGFFSTYGIGGLIGAVLGWLLFDTFSAPECTPTGLYGGKVCIDELVGMTLLPFVGLLAALGGLANSAVDAWQSNRD